jgi:hypothetical protein
MGGTSRTAVIRNRQERRHPELSAHAERRSPLGWPPLRDILSREQADRGPRPRPRARHAAPQPGPPAPRHHRLRQPAPAVSADPSPRPPGAPPRSRRLDLTIGDPGHAGGKPQRPPQFRLPASTRRSPRAPSLAAPPSSRTRAARYLGNWRCPDAWRIALISSRTLRLSMPLMASPRLTGA